MNYLNLWKKLAEDLGFCFKEGVTAFLESPSLIHFAGSELKTNDIEKAKSLLQNPLVSSMISMMLPGCVTGFYRDYEFTLFGSSTSSSNGDSRIHKVNIAMLFKKLKIKKMEIYYATTWTKIGKLLFGGRYIPVIGNAALNSIIAVRGKNHDQLQITLSDKKLQDELIKLFTVSTNFVITDYGIKFSKPGLSIEKEEALRLMNVMSDIAPFF